MSKTLPILVGEKEFKQINLSHVLVTSTGDARCLSMFGKSFLGVSPICCLANCSKTEKMGTLQFNVWNSNYCQNYSPDKLEVLFIDLEGRKRLAMKRNVYTTGQFWWKALFGSFHQLETNTIMTTTVVLCLKSEKRKLDMCGFDLFDVWESLKQSMSQHSAKLLGLAWPDKRMFHTEIFGDLGTMNGLRQRGDTTEFASLRVWIFWK